PAHGSGPRESAACLVHYLYRRFSTHSLGSVQNAKALKAKKEEGNKAFKEGSFDAAYVLYSEALTIDPNNIKTNAKLYCNRATVGFCVLCHHAIRFNISSE
uniref:Uncharacterized protein n=1 Tax=Hippocampus comes TaxID=109280 RepID=A0A3Q2Z8F1_HIPCM